MEDREYQRLKELADSGRYFHYRNFVFAGLIMVLLIKGQEESLKLFLDIEFPIRLLIIFLYIIIIVFTIITIDIFSSIWKTINLEFNDQIPFNWFILTGYKNRILSGFWITLPWILSSIVIGNSEVDFEKFSLIMVGFFSISLPNYLKEFAFKIVNREDGNGNKLTLSIYLLYWYRLLRNILLICLISYPIFNYFNPQEKIITKWFFYVILISLVVIFVIRILWNFIYKYIDKLGTKLGFAIKYEK
ncbi:MAG TPA: hypothetical protein VFG10_14550 [Saprospiraceae bacterium]|nr:hypothetical protein [Saprospiraceae bacterium]